jgi:hypothetical protein
MDISMCDRIDLATDQIAEVLANFQSGVTLKPHTDFFNITNERLILAQRLLLGEEVSLLEDIINKGLDV